jgi:ABC-type lipoprotein release transport system permease subunit
MMVILTANGPTAAWLPARAGRVNPVEALRQE